MGKEGAGMKFVVFGGNAGKERPQPQHQRCAGLVKIVAWCSGSKAESVRGKGYLFLMVMLLKPQKSMQGCSDLSFFPTKTKRWANDA